MHIIMIAAPLNSVWMQLLFGTSLTESYQGRRDTSSRFCSAMMMSQ